MADNTRSTNGQVRIAPSFSGKGGRRTIAEMMRRHVDATITRPSVQRQNIVLVRPKIVRQLGRIPPRTAPSFFRRAVIHPPKGGPPNPPKMPYQVGATITSQSVPGQNIVHVRPRTLGQTNLKEHNDLVPMEGDEEIFEEEAVCKNCFHHLKEENILKTECKCGNALIHEECAATWLRTRGNNNCDSCGQEVQTFPVALVRWLSGSTQMVVREESNKWSIFSRLMRI